MKRKFILLPITLTALAPAISLVGCGNPEEPEIEEPVFAVQEGASFTSETEAQIILIWDQNIEIDFDSWKFKWENDGTWQTISDIESIIQEETKSATLTINFSDFVSEQLWQKGIEGGILNFHYSVQGAKLPKEKVIDNISISASQPPLYNSPCNLI